MYIVFPRWRFRVSVFAIPCILLLLWLEGFVPFLLLMLSALIHEMGHLVAIKSLGFKVRRIDILPMGALIVVPEGIPYEKETLIALSGPFASLVIALVSALVFSKNGSPTFLFLCLINLVFGLFNLVPEEKLDGGKALFCFLVNKKGEEKTELICSAVSTVSKFAFLCFAIVFASRVGFNFGVVVLSVSLLIQLFSK